jgi:hypothetical protein
MAVLHRQSEAFDERNLFLQVTLGLLSCGARLDVLLDKAAPVGAAPTDGNPHPMELALLGAIATSARLRERLAAVVPAPAKEAPHAPAAAPPRPDALRRWLT